MTKRALLTLLLAMLLSAMMVLSAVAATGARVDIKDQQRIDRINGFNIGPYPMEHRQAEADIANPDLSGMRDGDRRPVGSATSANAGIGVGYTVDKTWWDAHWTWGRGRQVATYWNGLTGGSAEVSVHFSYSELEDTLTGWPGSMSGYNVYDATNGGDWPHLQNIGCDLQSADTAGFGRLPSIDMMDNGRVVLGTSGTHNLYYEDDATDTRIDHMLIYYQDPFTPFSCDYDPLDNTFGNTTWVDTLAYQPYWLESSANNARDPIVVTQFDGDSTVVHLLFQENYDNGVTLAGDHYSNTNLYHPVVYFRKVGKAASSGTWSTGQVIDSIFFVWTDMDAAPYPYTGVAVCYTNESYYGGLLNNSDDVDIWCRESFDRGVTWQDSYSITNYTNAIADHPNHFTAWLESGIFFDQDGDLHAYWCAKPTSADPYFDGFNWTDFDENVYHWEKNNGQTVPGTGDIIKVANGNFMNPDMLTGSMNTLHCGFGGSNAGYLAWIQMSQCDDKLYIVWAQIHERANRFPWRDAETQPAPGVLDDCSYTGARLAMANWEILMSVANVSTSSLWDAPRNISDTYTPDCGPENDPDAEQLCGSEWKPSLEKYALDESGLTGDLTWPAETEVDMSPGGDYAGTWYLNMMYADDLFPGPRNWGSRSNPAPSGEDFGEKEAEMKWVRLACVEPIEASQIQVIALGLEWPAWVETGQTTAIPVTVVNEGNVMLNVTDVTTVETTGSGWLSASIAPTSGSPFQVTAGVVNTATFDIQVDATAISQPTWLDGTVTLTSDAANYPTYDVSIHLLAAAYVEPVYWDTVMTHQNMFSEFFDPVGECVALAVGNNGDLGWGAGSGGSINMDYVESGTECGDRGRDAFYLIGATPFTIMADDATGTNAVLTQVFNDADQADETGWDPTGDLGSMANGQNVQAGADTGNYDYTYTGRFVNRDTTIAMEREVFAPRSNNPADEMINFVVVRTKVYSADGQAHSHVTFGDVIDWDVPADSVPNNSSYIGSGAAGDFLYLTGTDTANSTSCQSNVGRLATHAFGGFYTTAGLAADGCDALTSAAAEDYYGFNALDQALMVDTTHYRDGTDLVPDQPLPDVWWDETSVPGLNAGDNDLQNTDQAVWCTYRYDYSIGATEELVFWTVISTTRNADETTLAAQVDFARCWFAREVMGCTDGSEGFNTYCNTGCCAGVMRGDVNGSGDDMPTIGDISVAIDAKFITGNCGETQLPPIQMIACYTEADVNESGSPNNETCDDVTIGDVSMLIDFLFITGPANWSTPNLISPCP